MEIINEYISGSLYITAWINLMLYFRVLSILLHSLCECSHRSVWALLILQRRHLTKLGLPVEIRSAWPKCNMHEISISNEQLLRRNEKLPPQSWRKPNTRNSVTLLRRRDYKSSFASGKVNRRLVKLLKIRIWN